MKKLLFELAKVGALVCGTILGFGGAGLAIWFLFTANPMMSIMCMAVALLGFFLFGWGDTAGEKT